MATVAKKGEWVSKGVYKTTWEFITDVNKDGDPETAPALSEKSVHLEGDFGGGTIVIQGRNDTSATFVNMVDPQGNALSFATMAVETILDNMLQIRPFMSATGASAATGVRVTIISRSTLR